ncbi:hypothetical protein C1893_07090 [Pseudomonas sp. MPR-ANC1]|uniref:hypothetical protein n=1 Tax=Pseudomonas sp. MPR-ANC1 TaxID=2075548 RepID=UPI000CD036E8|nr:hypothetical protein [Pseudomonas sp. MPR-ANC1]POA49380.1 hypothetical protein C1893_07090 [Pseudomonas sp. MPR-ANC1]
MKDALTAFAISDISDPPSLNSRTEREGYSALVGSLLANKAARKVSASTIPALDAFSSLDQLATAQSLTAFDELDRRRSDTRELENSLSELRAQNGIHNAGRIADRIIKLLELYKEDYNDKSLSFSSLNTFIRFLVINPRSKFPSITATPAGELYVQWKYTENQRLGIHFLSGNEVKWILFKKDPLSDERIEHFSDKAGVDSFYEVSIALGIREWIVE